MMNQSAQGLASLGRGNDSMLVHMTPREVQGLQGLAMAHGGSLTINPKTGLPEAGFLDSILPTVAGFGLNALFPGLGALGTGLLVGGVTALTSGDLGKGVLAGFGAGSGAGLGSTFSKMGQSAIGGITPEAAKMAVGENIVGQLPANVAQNAASNLGMFNSVGATPAMGAVGNAVPGAALSNFNNLGLSSQSIGPGVNSAVNAMGAAPSAAQLPQSSLLGDAGNRLGDMYKGASEFAKDPFGAGYDAFKAQGGNTFDLLSPVASVGMEALKPEPYAGYQDPDKDKYRGPQGQLNLSDRFDTGLRLVAKGGYIDGYAMGGTVQSGGIRDLYGTPDNPPAMSSGLGGFGLGRLNDLASEQARSQAQTLGYDEGGAVGGGDASGDAVTAETTSAPADYAGMSYDALVASGIHPMNAAALKGMPMPGMSSPAPSTYTGSGSSMSGISSLAPSISYMPSTSYGAGTPEYIGGMPSASYIESMGYRGGMPTSSLFESMGYRGGMPSPSLSEGRRKLEGYADGGNVGGEAVDESAPNPEGVVSKYTTVVDDKGVSSRVRVPYQYEKIITKGAEDFYDIPPLEYAANLYPGSILPKFKKEQMAKGGYLNGQGDGMSDSIPATIEGRQPARLADGEFVVPADVVSHLGNGSSKAGSKRLYAMLDKVRHARTGNKKQGKQINPAKYMPA